MNSSSRRDPRAYLWDAIVAAEHIATFVAERSEADYLQDVLLRSATERQLEIIGEALNALGRIDGQYQWRIPELGNIVGLRNILIHGYAEVDDARVWAVARDDLPRLIEVLHNLLSELEESE